MFYLHAILWRKFFLKHDPSAAIDDYELSPVAAEFYRQIRGGNFGGNSMAYRRLPWNARIRPGMAGGFRKRVSERDISNMLKGTWLG
uniref:Uncharacterized protein n=1 Tax=Panagrolaimus sp. PS1159 TaxID=55785 RepID=A0AC35ERJ4_9BILA